MEHFKLEQWADFVRNVLKEKDKEKMQLHLDSGCKACSQALNTWTRFRQAASRESAYQPPDGAVRTVKAFLANQHRPARAGVAQLLFDSFLTPALAGVRSAAAAPARVMLYGMGDYRIDLRIEPRSASKLAIVGQILIASQTAYSAASFPIALVSGNKTLALLETTEFGEFACDCESQPNLRLEFTLPDTTRIRVPLLQPSLAASKSSPEASDSKSVKRRNLSIRKRTGKNDRPRGD